MEDRTSGIEQGKKELYLFNRKLSCNLISNKIISVTDYRKCIVEPKFFERQEKCVRYRRKGKEGKQAMKLNIERKF